MELSPRLLKIASLIPKGSVIADVGTDHGYIPVYCFQKEVITRAIAMDINSMPLKRAETNLVKYGFADKAELRLSDGLAGLCPDEADVIVIAGMGGLLIRDILKNGSHAIGEGTLLLLQPMIAPKELREYLANDGFEIRDEYVVREENKFYNIMAVQRGTYSMNDYDLYIGRNLKVNSPGDYRAYLEFRLRGVSGIIAGMSSAVNPDEELIDRYRTEKEIYQKYLEECVEID